MSGQCCHLQIIMIMLIISIIIIIITCRDGGGGELGGQPELERYITGLGDGATTRCWVLGGQFIHVSPEMSSSSS